MQQGALCLCDLDQSPPKSMVQSLQPLLHAIVKPELLKHQDREVKLFVASCICEITRITAPEAPYDDDVLKVLLPSYESIIRGENVRTWSSGFNLEYLSEF